MLKYVEVAKNLEKYIVDNDLRQGQKLPVFNELLEKYSISKSTLVKAFEVLEKRGIIYQIQGSGTFVRRPERNGFINLLDNNGLTDDFEKSKTTSKILKLEVVNAIPEIKKIFHCDDEDFYHLTRIRYNDGTPLLYEDAYYRKSVVNYIDKEIASGSMFKYIRDLGYNVSFANKYLKVGKLEQAYADELNLPKDSPALLVNEVYYLSSGVPFNYSTSTYNYQNSKFFVQSNTFS